MLRRIELIELISCIIDESSDQELKLKLEEVVGLANRIENEYPSIFVDVDKYSMETIRNKCGKAITIDSVSIRINLKDTATLTQIKKYTPCHEDKLRIHKVLSNKSK